MVIDYSEFNLAYIIHSYVYIYIYIYGYCVHALYRYKHKRFALDDSYLYFHKNKTLEWFRRSIENIRSKIKQ